MKKKAHIVLAGIIVLFIACMTAIIHNSMSKKDMTIEKKQTNEYVIPGE